MGNQGKFTKKQSRKTNFGFLSFFFPRSVTNRRLGSAAHASLIHAYGTWDLQKLSSCKATSSDAMICRAMKSHTNEHTVRGRPTLKFVKRFRKGSVCKAYERSAVYERTFWVNLSRIMLCCVMLGASFQPLTVWTTSGRLTWNQWAWHWRLEMQINVWEKRNCVTVFHN